MLMPQIDPDGYQNSSPIFAAKNLHVPLLLLHGTIDDNVHMQNTVQLIYELEKADKPFRLMVYPKSRHGVSDPLLVQHLRATMLQFIADNVLHRCRWRQVCVCSNSSCRSTVSDGRRSRS